MKGRKLFSIVRQPVSERVFDMTIKGENDISYECRQIDGTHFSVDTRNRKAFIMRKQYEMRYLPDASLLMTCATTHQDPKKSSFGGFGFEVL